MTQYLPNFITLCNLFSGCCALLFTLHGDPVTAAWCTGACFLFDYLDGMLARMLQVSSPLGKQLDSLADMVSFGAVPATMMYMLLGKSICGADATEVCTAALPAFVLAMFSGLRLGKFNLDTRQTTYFIGLSTPACTVFVMGITLGIHQDIFGMQSLLAFPWLWYALTAVFSLLLVSEIPMFGMKIKRFDWESNRFNLAFLALFLLLLYFLQVLAFSVIIILYILLSILFKQRITHEIHR
jgi:CDP-diacylglycerol---serine O-phosphatidyltransferase